MAEKIVKDSQGLVKDLVNDCISRRVAIERATKDHDFYKGATTPADMARRDELLNVMCWLGELPSAQPEPRWIPCSVRLPEHGGRYLISVLDGINRRTTVAPYLPRCKTWAMTGRMAYWKVIAWMPLPEPYREEEKDG